MPDGFRRLKAVPGNQPSGIVALPESQQRLPQLLNGLEVAHPQQVLLQRADEALRTAIPFRRPHESRRTLDPEKAQLILECPRHVLAAMVVPDRQA